MLGQKAATVERTQPGMCHQEARAQIPAPTLTGWETVGKRLHWSQPQCPHLYTPGDPSACFGVYEVYCASFKLLN